MGEMRRKGSGVSYEEEGRGQVDVAGGFLHWLWSLDLEQGCGLGHESWCYFVSEGDPFLDFMGRHINSIGSWRAQLRSRGQKMIQLHLSDKLFHGIGLWSGVGCHPVH